LGAGKAEKSKIKNQKAKGKRQKAKIKPQGAGLVPARLCIRRAGQGQAPHGLIFAFCLSFCLLIFDFSALPALLISLCL
jgi:hypothetical protein